MNAIPWYRSQVFISAAVAIIAGIVSLLGKSDVFPQEVITGFVEKLADVVATLASVWTLIARSRSKAEPIAATKASAEAKNAAAAAPTA